MKYLSPCNIKVLKVLKLRELNNAVLHNYVYVGVQIGWKNYDVAEILKIL